MTEWIMKKMRANKAIKTVFIATSIIFLTFFLLFFAVAKNYAITKAEESTPKKKCVVDNKSKIMSDPFITKAKNPPACR